MGKTLQPHCLWNAAKIDKRHNSISKYLYVYNVCVIQQATVKHTELICVHTSLYELYADKNKAKCSCAVIRQII